VAPAEDPQSEERRLQHERSQAFNRQSRAEHAPDEIRVHGPIHSELELLDETGGHSNREGDQQQRPEETSQPEPRVVMCAVPDYLHRRHKRS
jgi:hypothetical protein